MQKSIALNLLIATAEEGFSLDEFIIRLKEFAMKEGLPGIAAFFLRVLDELLNVRRTTAPKPERAACPHCGARDLEVKDIVPRQMTTTIGEVKFAWRRLVCASCKKHTFRCASFWGLRAGSRRPASWSARPSRCSASSPTRGEPAILQPSASTASRP